MPAVCRSGVLETTTETTQQNGGEAALNNSNNNNNSKTKFISSLTSFVNVLSGAQQSLNDMVTLSKCQGVDLSHLSSPTMYQTAAMSSETVDAVENQARIWIKEIEQVRPFVVNNNKVVT